MKERMRTMKGAGRKKANRKKALTGYLFIAPAFLGLVVFIFIPTAAAFVLSFFDWNIVNTPKGIGTENYLKLFRDPLFWNAIKTTLLYMVVHIPASLTLAFFMALAMKKKIRGKGLFRAAYILPWIITPVVVGFVWKWLLDPTFGVLNYFCKSVGLDISVLVNAEWFPMVSIAVINMWVYCGYHMLIFTAGLGNIPETLYEAAKIDGATSFQRVKSITLPLMRPTIMFAVITSVIGSFQIFDLIFGMYQGGPGDATRVYYYYIYNNAFQYFKMGYACAMSVILFVILVVITVIQYVFFQKDMVTDYSS